MLARFRVIEIVGMPTRSQDTSNRDPERAKGKNGDDPPHLDEALADLEEHAVEEQERELDAP